MRIRKIRREITLALIMAVGFSTFFMRTTMLAQTMSNGPYKITSSVTTGGFGPSLGSGSKVIEGTTGQPVAGGPMAAGPVSHVAGFWPAATAESTLTQGGPITVQFSQATYSVAEALAALTITVTRSGDTSAPVSVDYKTIDGNATQKADFEYAAGTLTFGTGETSKAVQVLINEDVYIEGNESFGLTLSNPAGASLGAQSSTIVSIIDDSPESNTNPIDDAGAFVHMHYHDFLNREPDAAGLAFWTNQITSCNGDATCIDAARANVSAAFYLSIEFQQTGYLLYLMQKESYATLPKYATFMRDLQEVSRGVVVNAAGWQQKLSNNQQQFAQTWANRSEFKAVYDSMSTTEFVNTLYTNAGIVAPQSDKDALVARLDNANETRATALLDVAANATFRLKEMNGAFVLMEYFGYLRRDPNASPDSDMSGYNFWLDKLNKYGDYMSGEMVRAFVISTEYRQRFGQ